MPLQLTRLTLAAAQGLPSQASPVTILVGPNNSGKSLALREIEAWARGSDAPRLVIDELEAAWPASAAEALEMLRPFETAPNEGEVPQADSMLIAPFRVDGPANRMWIPRQHLANQLQNGDMGGWLRGNVLTHFVARLDGRARFDLLQPRTLHDEQVPAQHHLAALFFDDDARQRVRDIVTEAFPGRYFVIDPTSMTEFRVGMSERAPADSAEEQGWDKRSREFHAAIERIETLSDGVVCFTGLIAAAITLPHRVLLVDEPEAFLHPPLARILGANLATLTEQRGASLVAATHSAEFLMGCIESGIETTIVRLTYESGVAGARVLAPAGLKGLIRDPLLRSTEALAGLFHRGVVVGESDHDRAFYNEINRRLVASKRGTADTFFTNAQNWQTIPRVIGPLRELGVPAAAIMDLDTVTGPKREWEKFYKAIGLDEPASQALEAKRTSVATTLRALGKGPDNKLICKTTGISGLTSTERAAARDLLENLGQYGIFVVDVGELECWLSPLNVASGSKAKWIVDVFRALGSNPNSQTYAVPGPDDVWRFLDKAADWIGDPSRAGLR
jgi:hypothetical protein